MKTPPRVLAVNSASNTKLEGLMHRNSCQEDKSIDFKGKDLKDTVQPHKATLVVTLRIGGFNVKKVMIDQGSGQR